MLKKVKASGGRNKVYSISPSVVNMGLPNLFFSPLSPFSPSSSAFSSKPAFTACWGLLISGCSFPSFWQFFVLMSTKGIAAQVTNKGLLSLL